jgi:ABC-type multidrug transport system ATPase subunit
MVQPKGTLFIKRTQLTITWPDGSRESFELGDVTRIGRGPENSIAIPSQFQSISRQHLEIRRQEQGYILEDLDSRNGVLVNGENVKESRLKDGDLIQIGQEELGQQLRMVFQLGTESELADLATEALPRIQTPTSLSSEEPLNLPHLSIRWPNGEINYFPVLKDKITIGREANADLRVSEALAFVSARQAEILKTGQQFFVRDLNSTNGTYLNSQRLAPNVEVPLNDNAILRIGDESLGVSIGITFHDPAERLEGFQPAGHTILPDLEPLIIGRAGDCNLQLDHPEVSRKHAHIQRADGEYWLVDLDSTNGTFLNGRKVKQAELHEGDLIQIANFVLIFERGRLRQYQSTGMRLDVKNLNQEIRTRRGKLRILDDINLSILPREFVAIVGGSGAGKTTLLNALIGYRPAQGTVQLNGQDFYAEYERYRSQLGFVPQNDILHMSLTVERGLDYAARLRLPGSLSRAERKRRIEAVLETVSMNTGTIRKTRIGDLSGGQRKRVSIAAELLADPRLIFLDEATSGLDPGLEKKLMHTLRHMADEGRTVVLITHATSNIVQTDHVAFLSQGKLIYFGPSREALEFFDVDDFADIYGRIEYHAEEWRRVFLEERPAHYQKYVAARQASLPAIPQQALSIPHFGLGDFFLQLLTLTQRNFNVLLSDPVTLALMLLLFPVTAFLQLVIAKPDVLTGNLAILADPVAAAKTMIEAYVPLPSTNTFVFVMGLEAVLVGLYVPPNELIRERAIYLRERTVNLKALPYLLSKVLIYTIFAAIQVVLYMLIVSRGVDFPAHGVYVGGALEVFITLFLTMMAGIGTGMIVAAVSRSTDMAIYMLVMLLFFQFFFAGTIFDLRGNRFEPMSYLTATRWSLNALGVTINMQGLAESTILCNEVPKNPLDPNSEKETACFNYPEASKDLMLDYATTNLARAWLVLIAMAVVTIGITGVLLRRMDPAT